MSLTQILMIQPVFSMFAANIAYDNGHVDERAGIPKAWKLTIYAMILADNHGDSLFGFRPQPHFSGQ